MVSFVESGYTSKVEYEAALKAVGPISGNVMCQGSGFSVNLAYVPPRDVIIYSF